MHCVGRARSSAVTVSFSACSLRDSRCSSSPTPPRYCFSSDGVQITNASLQEWPTTLSALRTSWVLIDVDDKSFTPPRSVCYMDFVTAGVAYEGFRQKFVSRACDTRLQVFPRSGSSATPSTTSRDSWRYCSGLCMLYVRRAVCRIL
jgi:hypothetical protein